jgi:hypothetical protein
MAKEAKFVKRERTITGSVFAQELIFSKFDCKSMSLENLAEAITTSSLKEISKQAVDLRFTDEAVGFFKLLIEAALQEFYSGEAHYDFLRDFTEVRVKDSTCFQIPVDMAAKYPGSGGASSTACIRIQFEYNVKTGKILDLSLHPFIKQDSGNAVETIGDIAPNVLIIRDLAYISVKSIRGIKEQGAYFVSRLISGADAYKLKGGVFVKINFNAVARYLKRHNLKSLEMDVYLTEKKEPVRMIAESMPEDLVRKRIAKAGKQELKKGRQLSQEYKAKAQLNLFITNVGQDVLSMEQIHQVYTIRWQVELIFKIWKSIGDIHQVKKMKVARFECCLYAKLLWIVVNWQIVWQLNMQIHSCCGKLLSFYKAYKSLKEKMEEFCIALAAGISFLRKFIERQLSLAKKFQLLDRKKDKNSMYELIQIM